MLESQKHEFERIMNTVASLYGKPNLTKDSLRVWWSKLERFDIDKVGNAFNLYTDKYQIMPNPASIIDLLQSAPSYKQVAYKGITAEQREKNKRKVRMVLEQLKNMKKRHPKQWAKDILSDPNYKNALGISLAKKALKIQEE